MKKTREINQNNDGSKSSSKSKSIFKLFGTLTVSAVLALTTVIATSAATQSEVKFADPGLNQCFLKNADTNKDGKVSEAEAASLTVLYGEGCGIKNLAGIERWTNITEAYLSNNNITNAEPLSALSNLRVLDLSNNSISNCVPFASMNSLYALDLSSNYIKDMSPVAFIQSLNTLKIGDNRLTTVPSLESMESLKNINVDNNKLTDLMFLQNNAMVQNISAENNNIASAEGIEALENISYINLCGNQITDVTPLKLAKSYKVDEINPTPVEYEKQLPTNGVKNLSVTTTKNKQQAFAGAITSLVALFAVVILSGVILLVAAIKSFKKHDNIN